MGVTPNINIITSSDPKITGARAHTSGANVAGIRNRMLAHGNE